jgi:hypothetical protein
MSLDLDVQPGLEFVFRIRLTTGAPLDAGTYDGRRHRLVPVLGGTVEGPLFAGEVLAGGSDRQTIRLSDGLAQIMAIQTLRHADGAIVSMTNRGVRRGPPEVMGRLAAGERVDPNAYYFRALTQFETEPGPHGWLAESVFVSVGKRFPEAVEIDVFRVV